MDSRRDVGFHNNCGNNDWSLVLFAQEAKVIAGLGLLVDGYCLGKAAVTATALNPRTTLTIDGCVVDNTSCFPVHNHVLTHIWARET